MKRDVATLLAILQRENARENTKGPLAQKIQKPEKVPAHVPTLDGGGRPISPMLHARFAYAGRWENAVLGQTWLSVSEMKKRRTFAREVKLRRENWLRSQVSKLPLANLSLLALDADDGDATYLVWTKSVEPTVLEFSGARERAYASFAAYLASHLGTVAMREEGAPAAADGLAAYLTNDARRIDLWIAGLERWGQPIVARAAIATARLVLPSLPAAQRAKVGPVLDTAANWANDPRGELPVSFAYALNAARPIAPSIEGKKTFEAMHACVQAAGSASAYHLERPIVIYADAVKVMLLGLRERTPADIARALNDAKSKTPAGAAWRPDTAKKALQRFEATLEHARSNASATVSHVIAALGRSVEPRIRRAVREALVAEAKS